MATLPTILRIPMKYERKMKRSVERGDIEELYRLILEYSEGGEQGPGYLGYLFYALYYTQQIQAYFKYIVINLSLTSKEKLKRNMISKLHVIRRGYLSIFSNYEWNFMEEYGYDINKIREKILTRKIDTRVDNYYYSTYFKYIRQVLERQRELLNSDYNQLYKLFNSLVRLGIEIFLVYSWTLYLYTFIFHFLLDNEDINNVVDKALEDDVPQKMIDNLLKMARVYGYGVKWIYATIKYAPSVFSVNIKIKYDKMYSEINIYGSWPPRILMYTFMILGRKLDPTEIKKAQAPLCRLCRLFWIGIYSYNGLNADIKEHTYSPTTNRCHIRLEVIKEVSSEAT